MGDQKRTREKKKKKNAENISVRKQSEWEIETIPLRI